MKSNSNYLLGYQILPPEEQWNHIGVSGVLMPHIGLLQQNLTNIDFSSGVNAQQCGYFVEVWVEVEGCRLSQVHPVLDHRNQPLKRRLKSASSQCLVLTFFEFS